MEATTLTFWDAMFTAGFWASFLAIVVADILLAGDNAVVIALAARSLPPAQKRKAIFWGSAGAIILRAVLSIVALQLLTVPGLKIIGGALLFWIGFKLLLQNNEEHGVSEQYTLIAAVKTILLADLAMSLDNVIAVAGAAEKAPEVVRIPLVFIGLALSVPLIIVGSTGLSKIMDRFPIIITLGGALLGYLAGSMLITDPFAINTLGLEENAAHQLGIACGVIGAIALVLIAKLVLSKKSAKNSSSADKE